MAFLFILLFILVVVTMLRNRFGPTLAKQSLSSFVSFNFFYFDLVWGHFCFLGPNGLFWDRSRVLGSSQID